MRRHCSKPISSGAKREESTILLSQTDANMSKINKIHISARDSLLKLLTKLAIVSPLFLWASLCSPLSARADQLCWYEDQRGTISQVAGLEKVPPGFRSSAKCIEKTNSQKMVADSPKRPNSNTRAPQGRATQMMAPAQSSNYLADPDQVELPGLVRTESVVTSLGTLEMRWPRKVEKLFGRSPHRAVADAIHTASRFVKQKGFPANIQGLNLNWNVVFIDSELPETQIPTNLIQNCHPAWMVPPAKIYVVAQRVAGGCNAGHATTVVSVNDPMLTQILLHEIGHAIEAALLAKRPSHEAERGEGFATWFEIRASDLSSVIRSGTVRAERLETAKRSVLSEPNRPFQGASEDYARSAAMFLAIEKSRGIAGLMRVYSELERNPNTFRDAVDAAIGWSPKELDSQAKNLILKSGD